jgi:hypothetical protein
LRLLKTETLLAFSQFQRSMSQARMKLRQEHCHDA